MTTLCIHHRDLAFTRYYTTILSCSERACNASMPLMVQGQCFLNAPDLQLAMTRYLDPLKIFGLREGCAICAQVCFMGAPDLEMYLAVLTVLSALHIGSQRLADNYKLQHAWHTSVCRWLQISDADYSALHMHSIGFRVWALFHMYFCMQYTGPSMVETLFRCSFLACSYQRFHLHRCLGQIQP